MKIRKKLKPKLIEEIDNHHQNPGSILNINVNLVKNSYSIHTALDQLVDLYEDNNIKKEILLTSVGQNINSLVTCWETFFRDLVLLVIELDNELKKEVLRLLNEKNSGEVELNKYDVEVGEFFSKQFNFQDLDDTCKALNFILKTNYNNVFEFYDISLLEGLVFSSINNIIVWTQDKSENVSDRIKEVIEYTFNERHKITHDANYRTTYTQLRHNIIEDCFLIFPQLISIYIARKYKQRMYISNVDKNTIQITSDYKQGNILLVTRSDFKKKIQEI